MGVVALVIKRARAGLGLLLTILVLAAGTTTIIAGTLGYSEASATTAAREALTGATPTEAGIRVQTRLADDPAAQQSAAEQIIRKAFAPTVVHIQRTVVAEPRRVTDQDGRLVVIGGPALSPQDTGFTERVEVVSGTWPTAGEAEAVEGALHEGAADLWGISVGDTLDVSGTPVVVTATWRPADAQEAFWFGDVLTESGVDGDQVGPLVVPDSTITSFGSVPFVRFTVQPDAEQILPTDMPRLAAVAGALDGDLRTPEVEVRGVTVEGDLAPTAAAAARNLATARALNLVPVILLLLVSLIAIVQIARLQAQARSGEVELLIARGAARRQILTWSVVESVAVAVVAAGLGTAAALGIMTLVPAGPQQSGIVVRTGILAGLAVLLALVTVAVLQVRTLAARTATDRSGRARTVAALGTVVLTLGAAAIAWWQLRRYGSPLVTGADGSLRTDLVAGAAPALLLAAAALLATMVLGPAGRFVEALSRRSRGLLTHLTAAQVSRRIVVYAVPVVLTVLAVGATTVAGLYAGTSASLRENLTDLGRGADIRAVPESAPVNETTLRAVPSLAGLTGVTATAPVWLGDTRVGSTLATLTLLPVGQLSDVGRVPDGALDTTAVTEALRGPSRPEAAVPLPADASSVSLDLELTVAPAGDLAAEIAENYEAGLESLRSQPEWEAATPEIREEMARSGAEFLLDPFRGEQQLGTLLWVWDESSASLLRVVGPDVPFTFDVTVSDPPGAPEVTVAPTTVDGTVQVPVTPGPGRSLVGIDFSLPQAGGDYTFELDVLDATAGSTDLLASEPIGAWESRAVAERPEPDPETPNGLQPTAATLEAAPGSLVLTGVSGLESSPWERPGAQARTYQLPVRAPLPAGSAAAGEPVPVAITESIAQTNNLTVGSEISVQVFGATLPARVAMVITAVPGSLTPDAVLLDSSAVSQSLAATGDAMPAPTQLWAASEDPDATLSDVRAMPGIASATGPSAVSVTDAASAVRLVFWVASAGAVLLAVTGIGAVAAALLGTRRAEVSVLRALGMTPGGQARARAAELASVVLASVGLGLLAGWLVSALVVPELSRSTTLSGQVELTAPLALEVPLWGALLAVLGLAMVALLAAQFLTVRGQALDNDYREEIR